MKLIHADCRDALKLLDDESVDAIVTDPPYGLEFMGKAWDKFTGAGMSQPGIGERETPWPSFTGSNTKRCGNCGLLVGNGGSPCQCEKPFVVNMIPERMFVYQAYMTPIFAECLRLLKPGGHLLAFGGSRTYHRLASAIEDAGFEIRDQIMWLYGSGFPKSLDVSKAIDATSLYGGSDTSRIKQVNQCRPGGGRIRSSTKNDGIMGSNRGPKVTKDAPATSVAAQWQGWGTALKPAHEPIVVARKPLVGTVAENVLRYGTGGLNIDACRVEHVTVEGGNLALNPHLRSHIHGGNGGHITRHETARRVVVPNQLGRWPANVIHDGSEDVVDQFPESKGQQGDIKGSEPSHTGGPGTNCYGEYGRVPAHKRGDSGSAARFFKSCAPDGESDAQEGEANQEQGYAQSKGRCGEASATKRYAAEGSTSFAPLPGPRGGDPNGRWPANVIHDGSREVEEEFAKYGERKSCMSPSKADCEGKIFGGSRTQGNLPMDSGTASRFFYCAKASKKDRGEGNYHPTVKPTELMRYLVRLVTPPGGTVLDPFMGSGSTGRACQLEGFDFIGIEKELDYYNIAVKRCA